MAVVEIQRVGLDDAIHKLMAIKFLKSLFVLNDRDILEEVMVGDVEDDGECGVLMCVENVLDGIKGNQRNINLVQSAALEMVN